MHVSLLFLSKSKYKYAKIELSGTMGVFIYDFFGKKINFFTEKKIIFFIYFNIFLKIINFFKKIFSFFLEIKKSNL